MPDGVLLLKHGWSIGLIEVSREKGTLEKDWVLLARCWTIRCEGALTQAIWMCWWDWPEESGSTPLRQEAYKHARLANVLALVHQSYVHSYNKLLYLTQVSLRPIGEKIILKPSSWLKLRLSRPVPLTSPTCSWFESKLHEASGEPRVPRLVKLLWPSEFLYIVLILLFRACLCRDY